MRALTFDHRQGEIRGFSDAVAAEFPELNILINNAGIQTPERLRDGQQDLGNMEAMVSTNLLGPMHLTATLLPLLERQSQAMVINVTSGLAFLPFAGVPTYCATKAAMHSYTQSLRYQLRTSDVKVTELIPPYVQTDLGPHHGLIARVADTRNVCRIGT
jgi:uncharacterized oxidoreductase